MGAYRALEAAGVVGKKEVVVAAWVAPDLRIIVVGREGERCATLPAPNHLRSEECLVLAVRCLGAEVAPVRCDLGVQLSEHDVGAVAAQHLRVGHRRQLAGLVGIAQNDLAGLEWSLTSIRGRPATPLDRRLADPVLETEGGPP